MPESEDRPELSQDALVEALVPEPDRLPDVVMLRGYLGKSGAEGTWRLYSTPELNDYVEIPADKILHSHRLPEDRGTMVWVPRGLVLEHKQVRSEDVQAEFLAGLITSRHLLDEPQPSPWLRARGAAGHAVTPLGPSIACPSWVVCPSALLPCSPPVISFQVPCIQSKLDPLGCY